MRDEQELRPHACQALPRPGRSGRGSQDPTAGFSGVADGGHQVWAFVQAVDAGGAWSRPGEGSHGLKA